MSLFEMPGRRYYMVYVGKVGEQLDLRAPQGGVTARCWNALATLEEALGKAQQRFPTKPREVLHLLEVSDRTDRKHVAMMERDWEAEYRKFEELMTVS